MTDLETENARLKDENKSLKELFLITSSALETNTKAMLRANSKLIIRGDEVNELETEVNYMRTGIALFIVTFAGLYLFGILKIVLL